MIDYRKNYQYVEDKIKQIYRFGRGFVNQIERNDTVFQLLKYTESKVGLDWWVDEREEELNQLLELTKRKEDQELYNILEEITDYEYIFSDTWYILQQQIKDIKKKNKCKDTKERKYLLLEEQYALKKWYVVSKALAKAQKRLIEKIMSIAEDVPPKDIPEARYYINKHMEICMNDMHLYCMVWHMLEYEYRIDNTINIVNEFNF